MSSVSAGRIAASKNVVDDLCLGFEQAPGLFEASAFVPYPAPAAFAAPNAFAFFARGLSAGATTGDAANTSAPAGTSASRETVVGEAPSWVSGLATASIASDMAAADVGGVVTYAGLYTLLNDLAVSLGNSATTLSATQFADLKTIVANLQNGMTTSSYLWSAMSSLVNGSAANAFWTGGGATAMALGNLAVGATATQLSELIGKWFLGTDLPSSYVNMSGSSPFNVTYSAVSNPLFGATGPSINDVNQGYLGDCYVLSCLAEVAFQNPSVIGSMFTDNGNNTYGVRFYVGGVAQFVTVNNQLADGGNEFNHGSNLWASLAEKAYAQLQSSGVVTGNSSVNYGNSWSTIGNGGDPASALESITGASQITEFYGYGGSWANYTLNASMNVTNYSSENSSASVLAMLVADLASGNDADLISNTDATDGSGRTTLVSSHALSIYGYDSATGNLEIRNPWGSEPGQNWNTTFEVGLATLLAAGDAIVVDNLTSSPPVAPAAPVLTTPIPTQTWKLGQTISFILPSNTFTDPQGQSLTFSATRGNGSALPSWLKFNAATGAFSGTVPNTATAMNLKVTATDTSNLSTSEIFAVQTPAAAPVLMKQTATQTWKFGQAVSLRLDAGTFKDPQGEIMTYSAKLASGAALPSWLSFNGVTQTFTGTVPSTAKGLTIVVTATDTSGLSTTDSFGATLSSAAPVLAKQTSNQSWKAGGAVSFALPAGTFPDLRGQTLTYSVKQSSGAALPSWLKFNATTKTFTGTAPTSAQTLSLLLTATDTSGLSASETFSASVTASAKAFAAANALFAPGSSAATSTLTALLSANFNSSLAAAMH